MIFQAEYQRTKLDFQVSNSILILAHRGESNAPEKAGALLGALLAAELKLKPPCEAAAPEAALGVEAAPKRGLLVPVAALEG